MRSARIIYNQLRTSVLRPHRIWQLAFGDNNGTMFSRLLLQIFFNHYPTRLHSRSSRCEQNLAMSTNICNHQRSWVCHSALSPPPLKTSKTIFIQVDHSHQLEVHAPFFLYSQIYFFHLKEGKLNACNFLEHRTIFYISYYHYHLPLYTNNVIIHQLPQSNWPSAPLGES